MKKAIGIALVVVAIGIAAYIVGCLALVWFVTPPGDCAPCSEAEVETPPYVVRVIADYGTHLDVGSGVLVRGDLILTAHHNIRAVRGGTKLSVQFSDGILREARVVRRDATQDLALLKIKTVLYQVARPALVEPEIGECVSICGFKKGKTYTVVTGKVVGRRSPTQNSEDTLFVIDGKSFAGMSGGPVLNSEGDVVGTLFGTKDYSNCTGLKTIKQFLTRPY